MIVLYLNHHQLLEFFSSAGSSKNTTMIQYKNVSKPRQTILLSDLSGERKLETIIILSFQINNLLYLVDKMLLFNGFSDNVAIFDVGHFVR
jgi:hypothetical protein